MRRNAVLVDFAAQLIATRGAFALKRRDGLDVCSAALQLHACGICLR